MKMNRNPIDLHLVIISACVAILVIALVSTGAYAELADVATSD